MSISGLEIPAQISTSISKALNLCTRPTADNPSSARSSPAGSGPIWFWPTQSVRAVSKTGDTRPSQTGMATLTRSMQMFKAIGVPARATLLRMAVTVEMKAAYTEVRT